MNITGLNEYNHSNISSKKMVQNSNKDINIAETFNSEVLNWGKKIKDRINRDLENDRENNINMSEKQWRALLNKVDNAINNQNVITDAKVDFSKPHDENKLLDDIIKKVSEDPVQDVGNASFVTIKKERVR